FLHSLAVFLTSHTSTIYTHLLCITACHLCKLRSVHGIALFSEFQSLHNTINYRNLLPRTKQAGEQIRKLVKERRQSAMLSYVFAVVVLFFLI
ncbi:MAG: hypothetical protein ACYT04_70850, partial [Nostoc sp.]